MEKALTCLLIAALLTLCVPNVAAAQASKVTPVTYSGHALDTDATAQQSTVLYITLMNKNGEEISTAKVNQTVDLVGGLVSGTSSAPNYIGGAKVTVQALINETWTTLATTTTQTGQYKGFFIGTITPHAAGVFSLRAIYDGDSQYAPTVSNVVTLTVDPQ
jgi:hypothetical protein